MKAVVFYGKDDVKLVDIEKPAAGVGEVIVALKACGVCGTDVHIFHGDPGSAPCPPGTALGHEAAGIVEEVGAGVTKLKKGDVVVLDPNEACGACESCLTGKIHYCTNKKCYGTVQNGGFAQYMVAGEKALYKVSGKLDFAEYAMAEPLSCCIHGVDLCNIQSGSTVVVFGAGGIGLVMVQLAKGQGAANVIVIEPSAEKRNLALKLGATHCIDSREKDIKGKIIELGCSLPETVIECAGRADCMLLALDIIAPCGVLMLFGLTAPDLAVPIRPYALFEKEITIKSSFINPYTIDRAIKLLESGAINAKDIIAKTIQLDELVEVLKNPSLRESGKVMVSI